MILIVEPERAALTALAALIGSPSHEVFDLDQARRLLLDRADVDVVLVGAGVDSSAALAFAESMRVVRPWLGVVLVRHRVDAGLLGDALRAGVREVVKERDVAAGYDAVARATALSHAMRDQAGLVAAKSDDARQGHLTTVFSAKGGCGKTTLATNLAAALADGGRRQVCLVDLDLAFGDVAIAMQLFPTHTLADAVGLSDSIDESAVLALLTQHSPGLQALVAPVEPGAAESIPGPLVTKVLAVLKQLFDHVVVDTPPAFTDHVLAAFDVTDTMALVTTLDVPALKNLKLTLETLQLLNYPRERWRVVLNRADSKVGLQVSEVEKVLSAPVALEIPSSRAVPAAINRGVPIVLDDSHHAVSVAIRRLADSIGGRPTAVVPAQLRADQRRFALRRRTERTS